MSGVRNNPGQRVVVAMSGGVDSSVAAALLVQAGFHVEGLMLRLWHEPADHLAQAVANRCCTPDQLADAERVAQKLGIPFETLDVAQLFRRTVVESFVAAYSSGLTPNPCLVCNRTIRFGYLLNHVRQAGADCLATGHYARIAQVGAEHRLLQGVDGTKDQSYVLYMLNQSHLPHLIFPLGEHTKGQIRALARHFGLPVAGKADSQDICFLSDGDYRRFLLRYAPESMQPGPILDQAGNRLGQHRGLPAYTVGQRKGLEISAPEPLYVQRFDLAHNALVVGPKGASARQELTTRDTQWTAGHPPAGPDRFPAEVRIRYRARPASAVIEPGDQGRTKVRFERPLADITPGQAAVFYQGAVCLGGGIIEPQESMP